MPTRVLVVEDDLELREVLALALEQEGFTVSAAENGLEGIVCLQFGPRPDAVVLNLFMPVMSGVELIDVIRTDPSLSSLPVVVVTGAPVPPEVKRSADAVLAKPFDIDALTSAIEALVARQGRPGAGESPPRAPAGL